MKLYVTVGTTSFDRLIKTLDSESLQEVLHKKGYCEVLMQIGRGTCEPQSCFPGITTNFYKYKDSLQSDIESADLAISHAGAGSCLEILGAGKPLLVVVNEDLMNNHQIELAAKLAEEGHLFYCTCSTLKETIESIDTTTLKPFQKGQPQKFGAFMDHLFPVSSS